MKKLRIIFLCVVMLLSSITTTFAQSEIDVTFDKMTIHINGSVGENNAGRQVSLQMIGPFDNVTKFDDAVEKLEQGVISKLDKTNFQQVSTDSKGDFLYDFYPKQQDEFYVVAVYVDGFDKVYSKELLSTPESIKQAIIQDVNLSQDISGLSNVFANER